MRTGIIVEGKSDAAVITNILNGILNISKCDIQYLVPELDFDETSLHKMREQEYSNWTIVKQNCLNREKISDFLETFEDNRFIVIHIDSDVRKEIGFDVSEPEKLDNIADIEKLRINIKNKIGEWLNNEYLEKIAFAIAIQEIDAWLLTKYDKGQEDTSLFLNPKERLNKTLNKPNFLSEKERKMIFSFNDNFKKYSFLSQDFRKLKNITKLKEKNLSLKKFCDELEGFKI